MIDWIISIFYFAELFGLLSFEMMITVNLVFLLVSRSLLIIMSYYILNKKGMLDKRSEDYNAKKRKFIIFSLKQIIIISLGMLYFPLALLLSFYAFLKVTGYLHSEKSIFKVKAINLMGRILTFLLPVIFILWFGLFQQDIISVAFLGLGILIYFFLGMDKKILSFDKISRYTFRKLHPLLKSIFLILLISLPITIIIGSGIYQTKETQTFMVEMNDGIRLSTDVYFAPGSFHTPHPVILIRTPYGKHLIGSLYGSLYLTQNYHVVIQDARGTFESEGSDKFLLFADAYKDGVATIKWILHQPWCNGKIASVGASALGINEYFYAGMNPEGLLAQSIMIATPDLYKTSIYPGGAFRESLVTGWVKITVPDNYEYQLDLIISHPMKDRFYNSTSLFMDIGPSFKNVSTPAIHIGGWYDVFQQGTLDGFMGYDDLALPEARGKQLLIMGPFTHGFPREGLVGELFYPTKSVSGFDLYLQWEQKLLDRALLGTDIDWTQNRVAYYLMGDVDDKNVNANDYRYAKDWPLPYENDTWYLDNGGFLTNNSLPVSNLNISYLYDPRNPVPTLGGNNLLIPAGPFDQSSLETRNDVLIWESQVFTKTYEIIGHMWAHLYVSSNCTNTDFTVKITDIYPDNRSMLLSDGIINTARRDGFNTTAPSLEGAIDDVWIDLWSTAYQFNVGHRIRIAVSSSNYPRFAANPNTGAPQQVYSYQYLKKYIANNTILTGPSYPSCILLPNPI
jgi:predicted acyl esterase